jgi:hypothetical protein
MLASTQRPFELLPRTISVLVAGHRQERLDSYADSSAQTCPALLALKAVLGHCARLCTSPGETDAFFPPALYKPGKASVRVMTGQADGVDQFAIDVTRKLHLPIDLVTPDSVYPQYREICEHTVAFGCPHEQLPHDDTPHAMRDELVLGYADVLVAVWDGRPARNRSSGVVWLIQRAVIAGLPVLWIDMQGQSHCVSSAQITEECLYRLSRPEPEDGLLRSLFMPCDASQGILIESLIQRLDPLNKAHVEQTKDSEYLRYYASERCGPLLFDCRAGAVQELMNAVFGLNRNGVLDSLRKMLMGAPVRAYFGPAGHDPLGAHTAPEPSHAEQPAHANHEDLRHRFAWSDVRANAAGGRHRSSIWILYAMASLSVLAAVVGAMKPASHGEGQGEGVWPYLELVFVLSILGTVGWSWFRHWHRVWLGHRFMAEQIRYLVMLQSFLAVPAPFREPLFVRTGKANKKPRLVSAESWILQRILSAEGFPRRYRDYDLCQSDLSKLSMYLSSVIRDQAKFHKRTRESRERMYETLHILSLALFGLAAVGVIVHFVRPQTEGLLLLTAFCPAFGAALHGIATKLEIARIAAQSQQLRSRLVTIGVAVSRGRRVASSGSWECAVRLRTDAIEVASMLSQENVQWRNLIRHQVTEIPA